MGMNRRQFLTASVAGAGVLGTAACALAGGLDYSVQGIDVSHWQGAINWTSVKNSGKAFAFCKATEGTTYTDPKFVSNWAAMRSVGLIRGAYHFGRPGTDPVAQANHFCNVVRPTAGDLQMTLDLETTDGKTPSQVRAWTVAFIKQVLARTGRPGIIYTGYYFWRDSAGNGSNLNCPLWLAYWGTGNPATYVPAAWSTWSFWQYTSTGSVPGVNGNVDRNAWNGTIGRLNMLRLP
jgi:GH25 family lysozyme M1 (1,4-beta-N-acetylmuramidase)